jgi:hypothetical protein
LKTLKDVLEVGTALVKEFDADGGADLLVKWMAHDLAGKLNAHKRARGKQRNLLATDCRDTILRLWKHRAAFPRGHRPFEEFDAVFRALESLDPERPVYRYFQIGGGLLGTEMQPLSDAQKWLKVARSIDQGARALVSFCVANATGIASKSEKRWLKAVQVLGEEDEQIKMVFVVAKAGEVVEKEAVDLDEIERKRLAAMRDHVTAMIENSAPLLKFIDDRVNVLSTEKKR